MKKNFLIFVIILSSVVFAQKPYVLLVSFDGFRWDYLDRGITPNLEQLYTEGVRALSFQPAFPSKTFPNHISIITGMYPANHGIIFNSFSNPFTHEHYSLSLREEVRNKKWYLGEPFWVTAKRNGIRTASFYWPASSIKDSIYSPDVYKLYDGSIKYNTRVDSVVSWFNLPQNKRPHFVTLYFSETDTYGHRYGPNSKEVNKAIAHLDQVTGYLIKQLKKINMYDSVNIIILSDHGMTDISKDKIINVENVLKEHKVDFSNSGPVMMIKPEQNEIKEVYSLLKSKANHFKVYLREEMPEYFHFKDNPFIYPIILVADLGWSLVDNKSIKMYTDPNGDNKGNHGYDNHELDMHGIFLAHGPAFKKGYRTGTVWNIDVYPLMCKILNIVPRSNIDGKLERIRFILK
jgi:ectonucleotide pyrophosphatase/phosphodiesterase family protein 5